MLSGSRKTHVLAPLAALVLAVLAFGPTPAYAAGSGASASSDAPASAQSSEAPEAGVSGDPSLPQPVSRADSNDAGANGQCPGGPYCSTRDGSASLNGNGDGQATGEPCAGCVGKADNKNPQGQMPNGSDHNAGYECDTNSGVGRTNPAHTGCRTQSAGPGSVTPPTGVTPGGTTPPGLVGTAVQASAPHNGPEVRPATGHGTPAAGLAPAARVLPNTGAGTNLAILLLGGGGLLLAGGLVMALRERVRR